MSQPGERITIVFCGPPGSGKTTCVESPRKLFTLGGDVEWEERPDVPGRYLVLDSRPLVAELVFGRPVALRFAVLPAAAEPPLRAHLFGEADGVVFVGASTPGAQEANAESLQALGAQGVAPLAVFWTMQDLPSALPVDALDRAHNAEGTPSFGFCALTGAFKPLEAVLRLVAARAG